ncbi:MAG: ATP-binding protein [Leptospiraceae bacterium]|nr:ATP-binding protein [Leptospiraceae bacterium]MCP5498635.1 ATP-binding protein [Leptospiraceae bacterium]
MSEGKLLFFKENENSYVMFIPPDMDATKTFRKELKFSLEQNRFSDDDISSIVLASDEALTNSISANLAQASKEIIICRWRIQGPKFVLFIMDYGKGFVPTEADKKSYRKIHDFLKDIQCHQDGKPGKLPFKGIHKIHRNMGQGIRIMRKLMDTVKVLYHANGEITETLPEKNVYGSILEIAFTANKLKQ